MNAYSDLAVQNPNNLNSGITGMLQGRIAGNNPGLRARFASEDEALGAQAANTRANSMQTLAQGGSPIQSKIRRNLQGADSQILQSVAGEKLGQEAQAAADQEKAASMGMNEQNIQLHSLDQARQNAMDMGDMGTAAALSGIYMDQGGYTPTDKLRSQQARAAADAADEENWAKSGSRAPSEGPMYKRVLGGVLQGAMGGKAMGGLGGMLGGGAVGGILSSIF